MGPFSAASSNHAETVHFLSGQSTWRGLRGTTWFPRRIFPKNQYLCIGFEKDHVIELKVFNDHIFIMKRTLKFSAIALLAVVVLWACGGASGPKAVGES
ncbi:MAG TPA: hypothetical protein VHS96_15415, partial [Bacteroidia bacterium]|nr:hypothetical protein [Bacteroidia bacterium]